MYTMVTILNSTLFHSWTLLWVHPKSSQEKFCHYAWWQMLVRYCRDHSAVFINIKSLCCIPKTDTCQLYLNKKKNSSSLLTIKEGLTRNELHMYNLSGIVVGILLLSNHWWNRLQINDCLILVRVMYNAKECSNYNTVELISHVGKVMLKILQTKLQQ